jgi:hypothetical protein
MKQKKGKGLEAGVLRQREGVYVMDQSFGVDQGGKNTHNTTTMLEVEWSMIDGVLLYHVL